jgi:DNA-binding NarL/FixJ family response regulator
MDLRLRNSSGIDAVKRIREGFPAARIITLTTYRGYPGLWALRADALGYLIKSSLRGDLLGTIRAVYRGLKVIPLDIATAMALRIAND